MNGTKGLSHFSQREIRELFKQARRVVKHPGLHILLAPTSEPHGRILVITPKKIGNAPIRNQIRRRLKAIFREENLLDKGFHCIVVAHKEGVQLTFDELKQLMRSAFEVQ